MFVLSGEPAHSIWSKSPVGDVPTNTNDPIRLPFSNKRSEPY